jgi:hypothetical protein
MPSDDGWEEPRFADDRRQRPRDRLSYGLGIGAGEPIDEPASARIFLEIDIG